MMTAARAATSSAASCGSRSRCSSAQRNSNATFCPAALPISPRPRRKAATRTAWASPESELSQPIIGMEEFCARATSGHTVAPPSIVMKVRLPMVVA
jgi:hypothetical protein